MKRNYNGLEIEFGSLVKINEKTDSNKTIWIPR